MQQTFLNRFGSQYQLAFCSFALRDSFFLSKTYKSLKPEYFIDDAVQRLIRILVSFFEEHKGAPSTLIYHEIDQLKEKGFLSVDMHKRINILLEELFAQDLQNSDYLLEEYTQFIRYQKIESTVPRLIELTKAGKFEDAETLVRDTFSTTGEDISEKGKFLTIDPRERVNRRQRDERTRIWTLIPEIDNYVIGLKAGEIGILQSQKSSIGKTAMLVLFTRNFLMQRKNVLFISLEEGQEQFEDRFDQCFTGCKRDRLTDILFLEEHLRPFLIRGKLLYAKLPEASTKISDMRAYAEELKAQKNFRPDVLVIDYIDKIDPETSSLRGDLFAAGNEIVRTWREWAADLDIPSWSASQSNRTGAEARTADQQHIQGSIGKFQQADVVLSINKDKEENSQNHTKCVVRKNRSGPTDIEITLSSDLARQLIWMHAL